MNTQRTFEIKPNYILYTVTGNYLGLIQTLEVFKEITELAEEHEMARVVFDITPVKKIPPVMDRYHLGVHAAKIWGERLKIAIITKPHEITGFFENIAANRGALIKVLPNINTAESWLGEEHLQSA